jgi:hypothetical protein
MRARRQYPLPGENPAGFSSLLPAESPRPPTWQAGFDLPPQGPPLDLQEVIEHAEALPLNGKWGRLGPFTDKAGMDRVACRIGWHSATKARPKGYRFAIHRRLLEDKRHYLFVRKVDADAGRHEAAN